MELKNFIMKMSNFLQNDTIYNWKCYVVSYPWVCNVAQLYRLCDAQHFVALSQEMIKLSS